MRDLPTAALKVHLAVLVLAISGCVGDHYEQNVRNAFDVPDAATFTVQEDEFGDGFKERLQYQAQFTFTDAGFKAYQQQIQQDQRWQKLPMGRDTLARISKHPRQYDYILDRYFPGQQSAPENTPTYSPEAEKTLAERTRYLNLEVSEGYYLCLTAGTDLMNTPKVTCPERSGTLNDLMLGVLDVQARTLKIRAYTGY